MPLWPPAMKPPSVAMRSVLGHMHSCWPLVRAARFRSCSSTPASTLAQPGSMRSTRRSAVMSSVMPPHSGTHCP